MLDACVGLYRQKEYCSRQYRSGMRTREGSESGFYASWPYPNPDHILQYIEIKHDSHWADLTVSHTDSQHVVGLFIIAASGPVGPVLAELVMSINVVA